MKLKLFAVLALIAVGAGALIYAVGGIPTSSAQSARYLTASVTRADVTQDASATGSVAVTASYGLAFGSPAHLVDASSSSSSSSSSGSASGASGSTTWHVTSVKTSVGKSVKKGDVLATASVADLQAQLAQATNSWRSARIQLSVATDQLSNASTTDQTRQAQMAVYNAKNQVAQTDQTRRDLQTQITYATLRAPIAGTVVEVNVDPGFDAPSGDAIVINAASLEVTADVVESDLPTLSVGQPAQVVVSAVGATLSGKVTTIAPVASSSSGSNSVVSYAVTVSIADPSGNVRPGMSADVSITTAQAAGVLSIPVTALVGSDGQYAVRVMDASGQIQSRTVTVGLVTSSRAEIKNGLTEGETVVTGVATTQTVASGGSGLTLGGGGLFGGGGVQRGGQGGTR